MGATVSAASKLGPVVGGATAQKLQPTFDYETVGDLLGHYPRTYVDRGQTSDASDFSEGEIVTLVATVVSSKAHTYTDRRTGRPAYRLEVLAQVEGSRVVMTFFDRQAHT